MVVLYIWSLKKVRKRLLFFLLYFKISFIITIYLKFDLVVLIKKLDFEVAVQGVARLYKFTANREVCFLVFRYAVRYIFLYIKLLFVTKEK